MAMLKQPDSAVSLASMSLQSCTSVIGVVLILLSALMCNATALVSGDEYMTFHQNFAVLNITYYSATGDLQYSEIDDEGHYGFSSRILSESGFVVHVKATCSPPPATFLAEKWIAILEKSSSDSCKLNKLLSLPSLRNASAVVIFGSDDLTEAELPAKKNKDEAVHVFIKQQLGERIVSAVDNSTRVYMQISAGRQSTTHFSNTINKTSMLFLSISFIVLMIISLAWLVFYYVQRSRYTYAKQRLSRIQPAIEAIEARDKRLMCAAKKAISKMPLRTVRSGDEEMDAGFDLCAVCIEGYRSSDVVRILPCKHVFHKVCIDPWLIEHRSCPICKIDILKAYGLQVHRSRESIVNVEPDVVSTSYGYSEFVSPDGGYIGRDFDSDGVEIVRFQLAHIEYHNTPSSTAAEVLHDPSNYEEDVDNGMPRVSDCTTVTVESSRRNVAGEADTELQVIRRPSCDVTGCYPEMTGQTPSIYSSKSEDSEPNETQSLMTDNPHDC